MRVNSGPLNRLLTILLPILLVGGGIALIVLGIQNISKNKTYTETTAVITEMIDQSYYDEGTRVAQYDIQVQFTVDGKTVTAKLDEYRSGFQVGKEVKIKYNPDNPTDIVASGSLSSILLLGLGIVAIISGAVAVIRGRKF